MSRSKQDVIAGSKMFNAKEQITNKQKRGVWGSYKLEKQKIFQRRTKTGAQHKQRGKETCLTKAQETKTETSFTKRLLDRNTETQGYLC